MAADNSSGLRLLLKRSKWRLFFCGVVVVVVVVGGGLIVLCDWKVLVLMVWLEGVGFGGVVGRGICGLVVWRK